MLKVEQKPNILRCAPGGREKRVPKIKMSTPKWGTITTTTPKKKKSSTLNKMRFERQIQNGMTNKSINQPINRDFINQSINQSTNPTETSLINQSINRPNKQSTETSLINQSTERMKSGADRRPKKKKKHATVFCVWKTQKKRTRGMCERALPKFVEFLDRKENGERKNGGRRTKSGQRPKPDFEGLFHRSTGVKRAEGTRDSGRRSLEIRADPDSGRKTFAPWSWALIRPGR